MRAAETVGWPTRGDDRGKKIEGRKHHTDVDPQRLLLVVLVAPANRQDRDAEQRYPMR